MTKKITLRQNTKSGVCNMKFKLTIYTVFQIAVSLGCVLIFFLMVASQLKIFNTEPTGTSWKKKSVKSMPFPAISICDHNFDYGRAFDDIPLPRSIFSKRPRQIQAHPYNFYRALEAMGADITSAMWEYYFTLDKILHWHHYEPTILINMRSAICRVGTISCFYGKQPILKPNNTHTVVETEVPAGKWTSKFMTDSYRGTTYLCHTLISNVTVDFSLPEGNSIALRWNKFYANLTNSWTIYVHDKNEHVLLNSYALETLPSMTISKTTVWRKWLHSVKKKSTVIAKASTVARTKRCSTLQ